MAKTIQIRNVPDDVHRALRSQAAAAGKSLSDYLLAEVEEVAARPTNAEILRRAAERGGGVAREEIVAAVRSGRDR
jgi:plasmid stability protein